MSCIIWEIDRKPFWTKNKIENLKNFMEVLIVMYLKPPRYKLCLKGNVTYELYGVLTLCHV